jgi:uncharacterized membrane protein
MMAVCYLGDGNLTGAASYLAGVMAHFGIAFEHFSSGEPLGPAFVDRPYALYVVSDYPAANFHPVQMAHLVDCVRGGSGLLMIGGWESFHGRLGEYQGSPLAEVLPVAMQTEDDRRNCPQSCVVWQAADHPLLAGLPWDRPPSIGGFNAIAPKPGAATLLVAREFDVRRAGDALEFSRRAESPLLVVGQYGRGRTAALATDVAPHWVGGLVDWGDRRIVQQVAGAQIEVGNWYAQFFHNLLDWTGRLGEETR